MEDDTSLSMLSRLKRDDEEAWFAFVAQFGPFLRGCLSSFRLQAADVDDLVQDLLVVVRREIPAFDRRRLGSFRAWMRECARRRCLHLARRRAKFEHRTRLEDVARQLAIDDSDLSQLWDEEHDRYVLEQIRPHVRTQVSASHWEAFELLMGGLDADQVAQRTNLSVNAVKIAKHRILAKLKEASDRYFD